MDPPDASENFVARDQECVLISDLFGASPTAIMVIRGSLSLTSGAAYYGLGEFQVLRELV